MNSTEEMILNKFKESLLKRLQISDIILFGSRARGDANTFSYEHGIVVVPVVFTKDEWENGPERFSLLAQAVEREGMAI